jgi:hypothetical protein
MFARLERRSRKRWTWRTRALPRRRPFRGSREKGKGMVRNLPIRAGGKVLATTSIPARKYRGRYDRGSQGARQGQRSHLQTVDNVVSPVLRGCTASARLSGMVQSPDEKDTVDLKARERDTSIGDACARGLARMA